MSKRLYYTDAYTVAFEARVVEVAASNGRLAVVLDESYFYPASGGQPADCGTLNDVAVVDVSVRPADGAVLHHLAAEQFTAEQVHGRVDWQRRFHHMQHHTGQHILSRAFINVAEAETVGFHMGSETMTIDLDRTDLSAAELAAVEQMANEVVWQNRPVMVSFVEAAEAAMLPLRKTPTVEAGQPLRLIDIQEFDLTACGGTHVGRTGEVGVIKIIKQERRGEKTRIEFACGRWALEDYGRKNETVYALMEELTTGQPELLNSVQKLKEERREAHRAVKQQQKTLQAYEAEKLLAEAEIIGGVRVVVQVFTDKTAGELKTLTAQLTAEAAVVALTALAGEKARLLFKRSEEAAGAMNLLLKETLHTLGSKAGGGTAELAQGGGFTADESTLWQALQQAKTQLRSQLLEFEGGQSTAAHR